MRLYTHLFLVLLFGYVTVARYDYKKRCNLTVKQK